MSLYEWDKDAAVQRPSWLPPPTLIAQEVSSFLHDPIDLGCWQPAKCGSGGGCWRLESSPALTASTLDGVEAELRRLQDQVRKSDASCRLMEQQLKQTEAVHEEAASFSAFGIRVEQEYLKEFKDVLAEAMQSDLEKSERIATLETQNAELKASDRFAQKDQEIRSLEVRSEELEAECHQLHEELDTRCNRFRRELVQESRAAASREAAAATAAHDALNERLQDELQAERGNLLAELREESRAARAAQAPQQLTQAAGATEALEALNAELQAELREESRAARVAQAPRELTQAAATTAPLEALNAELQAELREESNAARAAQALREELHAENNQLRGQLLEESSAFATQALAARAVAQARNEDLQEECNKLRGRLQEESRAAKAAQERFAIAERRQPSADVLRELRKVLGLDCLEEQLEEAQRAKKESTDRNAELCRRLDRVERENKRLAEQLVAARHVSL